MAQAFDEPATILDGNVKRVMARHAGIATPIEQAATIHRLYDRARAYTPAHRSADYTQAIMDLGATVCLRGQPLCDACPVADDCVARRDDRTAELPMRRTRMAVPVRTTTFVALVDADERLFFARRAAAGVWGGLWCLPECPSPSDSGLPRAVNDSPEMAVCVGVDAAEPWANFEHRFTHFILRARVLRGQLANGIVPVDGQWLDANAVLRGRDFGLPKPIHAVLSSRLAKG